MSVRNLSKIFVPRSAALIGATPRPGSVGALVLRNLRRAGFRGELMLVNPRHRTIDSLAVYSSVGSLPRPPDLAIVATPPQTVPSLIAELGALGTRGAVVITSGFGELGEDGRALQQQSLEAAKPHLLRLVGPNCLGIMVPRIGLDASFSHLSPPAGDIALVSQSGALVTAMLDWAAPRGIGFSHVVSLGDMADVDFGDLLDYLAAAPETRAILLYVEAVTHGRKFMSAARAASRTKPVLVLKAGRSTAGAWAASSHTGALAGADAVYDAAFRRAGMLRVDTMAELFEAAETLALTRDQRGERLAMLTNGGGAGVLAADALIAAGGTLATLPVRATPPRSAHCWQTKRSTPCSCSTVRPPWHSRRRRRPRRSARSTGPRRNGPARTCLLPGSANIRRERPAGSSPRPASPATIPPMPRSAGLCTVCATAVTATC